MDVLKKIPVREQDPKVRAANFEEVCLGYNQEEAQAEAARCINCKNAQCIKGCPVAIDVYKRQRLRTPTGSSRRSWAEPWP